ncbi:MAG: polysaccharide biosynthesis C-terminal domain-containing protein [Thermoflavifilum sp.]|uniref:lipopolysaccharide biosynthesis protein n=1 Tax=Thermoflavifilum sp. TaxID=1968839 RepID=UPI0018A436AB|nr:polysaccharide biosynthesis C-terminal domain-containing protein [Thermoflavifilum sp.]QOR75572.1 MAG: polysaccharide biosynthesis C-terminal domain-containing protein [Thermoflavifilum sp.]
MGIVRRQSIQSTIFIYAGFAIGAFNVLVLFTHFLSPEQFGLIQLMVNAAALMAALATLGTVPVVNKFFPFYHEYLKPARNDLPLLVICICLIGFGLFILAGWLGKGLIIRKFSGNSPLFVQYYFWLFPMVFFMLFFTLLESFAWGLRKTVLTNLLRETIVRLYGTVLIAGVALRWISVDTFIKLYSGLFAVPALVLLVVLIRSRQFQLHIRMSSVTRRLWKRMLSFSLYVFSSNVFNVFAKTMEIFFISSINGLAQTGVYSIADYIIRLMEVPQRGMASITTPLLAVHWKNKDYREIEKLYHKSSATLLIAGLAILGLICTDLRDIQYVLPEKYRGISWVVWILGAGKLIDLGTGVNNQVIQTSHFWKFDFYTNIFFTVISIILNYFLVHRFGMLGAAITAALSLSLFNFIRCVFIYWRFRMQPFRKATAGILLSGIAAYVIATSLPLPFVHGQDTGVMAYLIDAVLRGLVYIGLFGATVLYFRFSEDVNQLVEKWWQKLKNDGENRL